MAPASSFVVPALLVPAVTVHHPAASEDLRQEERDSDNIVVGVTDHDTFMPPGATLPSQAASALPSVATPRLAGSTNAGPPDQLASRTIATGHEATNEVRAGTVYTVEPGDNLWTIAAQHLLTDDPATQLTESRIAPYWARVVELNRPSLRSQNPDWIYPGEEIRLPAIDE
jgi:nucleoid-associated protein YgaU